MYSSYKKSEMGFIALLCLVSACMSGCDFKIFQCFSFLISDLWNLNVITFMSVNMLNDIKKSLPQLWDAENLFCLLKSEKVVTHIENFHLELKQNVCKNLAGYICISINLNWMLGGGESSHKTQVRVFLFLLDF